MNKFALNSWCSNPLDCFNYFSHQPAVTHFIEQNEKVVYDPSFGLFGVLRYVKYTLQSICNWQISTYNYIAQKLQENSMNHKYV